VTQGNLGGERVGNRRIQNYLSRTSREELGVQIGGGPSPTRGQEQKDGHQGNAAAPRKGKEIAERKRDPRPIHFRESAKHSKSSYWS
jgi:hypothetical protein